MSIVKESFVLPHCPICGSGSIIDPKTGEPYLIRDLSMGKIRDNPEGKKCFSNRTLSGRIQPEPGSFRSVTQICRGCLQPIVVFAEFILEDK